MSLQTIKFSLDPTGNNTFSGEFAHVGVVGSGDLEILFEISKTSQVEVELITPVEGFEHIWQLVIERFIEDAKLAPLKITINDNNATPAVVAQRLRQINFCEVR